MYIDNHNGHYDSPEAEIEQQVKKAIFTRLT